MRNLLFREWLRRPDTQKNVADDQDSAQLPPEQIRAEVAEAGAAHPERRKAISAVPTSPLNHIVSDCLRPWLQTFLDPPSVPFVHHRAGGTWLPT